MFRQRDWAAVLAIWTILAQQEPAAGGFPSSEKIPSGFIGRENRQVGQEIVGKNSATLTDGNSGEIYRNQFELGSSRVPGPSDILGKKVDPRSRESRIKKKPKNYEPYIRKDSYSSGLNFEEEKLPRSTAGTGSGNGRGNGEGKPLEADKYGEHKWRITRVGSALNEVKMSAKLSKRNTVNPKVEKLGPRSSRAPGYGDNADSYGYKKRTLISSEARKPAGIESTGSRLLGKGFERSDGEINFFGVAEGSEELKVRGYKLSRDGKSGTVEDNDEGQSLVVSDKKMQRQGRFARGEKSRGNKVDKEIDVEESLDFVTAATAASAKAQIVDGVPKRTTESFNDSRTETGSMTSAESGSYNQRETENSVSSRSTLRGENPAPMSRTEDHPISGRRKRANFDLSERGASGRVDEFNPRSQEAVKCIGKTEFNKELPIGLAAVNYAGYIPAVGSDSNTERNPVPEHETEESYRGTDVARDMSHGGDAGVPVAEGLDYSDTGFTASENRESLVRKIVVKDDGEIGIAVPAQLTGTDTGDERIPGGGGIDEKTKSRLRKGESPEISSERIRSRGEIPEGGKDDLPKLDETVFEISETVPKRNSGEKNEENNKNNGEFRGLENLDRNSREIIGSNDHVPRELPGKIAALLGSSKENGRLGIIERLNGSYLGTRGKKTVGENGVRDEMTSTLNIGAVVTPENSSRYNNEESKKPRDVERAKISAEVNVVSEIHCAGSLSNENDGRIGVSKSPDNRRDADVESSRRNGNLRDKFELLVQNSGPIQGRRIERNEDEGGATIDVPGESSGNLLSDSRRDGRVIRNFKFTVPNSKELPARVNKDEDPSSSGVKKIDGNVGVGDTREQDNVNLSHPPPLFQSNTDGNAAREVEIDTNTTLVRTAMTGITPGLSLTVDLVGGGKNDGELRDEVNRYGVSRTMGKKKSNLSDKLWSSKPEVENLSALDIAGRGFLTERYFEVDSENSDPVELPGRIVARRKVLEEKQSLTKLKQSREFRVENSNNPEVITPKFFLPRLSGKYLASKNKRAMKSSGGKINPDSVGGKTIKESVDAGETTASSLPNIEEEDWKADNVSREKTTMVVNKSETSTDESSGFSTPENSDPRNDSVEKFGENNTRIFSQSFADPREEEATTLKSPVKSVRLFPENDDDGWLLSALENSSQLVNSTEISVPGGSKDPLLDGDNTVSDRRVITTESNQARSSDRDGIAASRNFLKVSGPVNGDLLDRGIAPSLPQDVTSTENPAKTSPDVFEVINQSLNPQFSFNQTDSDNASRVSAALNQWPVKHSAVVEGDLVLGGLMMVHEREDSVTCGPVMPQGGVQALEAMLYTLDRLNKVEIIPGVKIGAHILDDCDKDTYGLEMAVDFIKGSISNIDGAEYHCNKTAVRKVISGVVGAASSVTSIQVANLLRLFRIPQVSFFSTSPELSNKQRFEYFSRTIPSDHYQVKAMVDIVKIMNWSYVSIIYEESNYGIKAFEELEELLAKYDICIAIKEKLVKDSGVADETAYDNIVQKLLTKPRARGCIIFGSDQEVAGVMRAVRRCNATGAFSWIGSDGWSARGLVSDGNEPEVEGTLSVQPQANPVKGFEEYFLDLTVENNRRNPWFVEFWEDHFQCRYPNASWTPYNQKYTKPCTTKERLTKQNTAFEDQLQFVSDAVTAFAYAFRDMHRELCFPKPGLCDAMKPTKGTELLKYLRKVEFEGLSGDKFRFDKNGDGPARYNIIHFKQASPGKYKWVRVGEYIEGELRLNRSEIQFRLGHPLPPESVCSLPCEVGQAKKYVEGESCCWHCFNCTQYQVRDPIDETQCIPCRKGTVPDETHSNCRDIPEEFLRPESGWAIGAMSFSATGILVTLFVGGVFLRHNDTPVVRASGRELSYVLLTGILLCYLVTFALVLRPNDIVCGIQRFGAGFCFTVVYAALLTKTNRISRIFNAGKQSAKRPSFISPRSQLIICSGLMGIQILINGVWMIIDPAKAMHHYPTRDDNLLVCNSYIDASYMIAFSYPIILIVVCTVYAVLTRKIPEAFNESKHIGFTMYTTCVIWLAFVPLYFGTGNHVALRITSMSVTISLSASVTIACLFSPKLYIILIRPERNVRQSMMPARYSTTKSSAVTGTNASSMMAAVTLTAATCDQNKAVKRHVTTTIDCSTQSEHYEMEVKEDRINGKAPGNFISRSTQTHQILDSETNSTRGGTAISTKDITSKEIIIKDSATLGGKQSNNVRIGNGPVSQKDGAL